MPDVINSPDNPPQGNSSRTSQVNPDSTVEIPDIPEPTTLGLVAAAGLLALPPPQVRSRSNEEWG